MIDFREDLHKHFDELRKALSTDTGEWVIKGFIDTYRNIYTISDDTKVISKIIELMMFPVIAQFSVDHNFKMYLSEEQNHYPNVSFETPDGEIIALDFKSAHRTGDNTVNGMTLGAFTGYFRNRDSKKNITFPHTLVLRHIMY